jgi:transposase
MIRLPETVYVATAPVNLRLSFDRLAGIVREALGGEPRGEAVFVFHNRVRTHLKLLWHDGTGYCVIYKRLDRGRFRIPLPVPPEATRVVVSRRELAALFEGVDTALLRRARAIARAHTAAPRRRAVPALASP